MTPSDAPVRTMLAAQPETQRPVRNRIRKRARRVVLVPIERSEFYSEQQAPPADVANAVIFLLQCAQPTLEPVAQLGCAWRQPVALYDFDDFQPDHCRQRIVYVGGIEEEAAIVCCLRGLVGGHDCGQR
jgi:hypothetical protein